MQQMGRALDNGLVRNNLFTQWTAKVGSAAKACGKAAAKERGEAAAGKGSGEAAGKGSVEPAVDHSSPGFIIPGLWSPAVARLNKFYDDINQSLVFLKLKLPTEKELKVNQLSYLMSGSMSIKDLSDRVRYKVNLDVCCPLKFSVDGNVLAEDSRMTSLFKNYAAEDGYTYLNCDSSEDPLSYQWTLVENNKKRMKTKSASSSVPVKKLETFAVSDQQTEEVIEESVPYAKWLNWKTKGNRKKSQHVKKKQMELAMHQRSPFVETRDGPAILSFGTYAPNGNLQFY